MTPVATFVIRRRVTEPLYIPGCNSMAGPAVIAEFAVMGFKMTFGAGKIAVKKRVIHFRNIRRRALMLRMALQAVFLCLMKTDLWFKRLHILEIVALQAVLACHPLPRDVAGFTITNELVSGT